MHDSVVVQVSNGDTNLICQLFDPLFREFEVSELDVIKEVFTLHVFKYDIVVIGVFEEIYQCDNVWMLTLF